ncbi:F0F1 ATP synthase subunit delta [Shouchella shacheensis]|uniref:F0F1 ATP synthase subunit delta n=1 Tax=Shouchella shacheensis TaxID=1649580 RepID=UPI00073FF10C|nr:F0F1 ATP synthase subunit delta [Shouchella shacheensis]
MSNKAVANRYAVALFELAEERGQTEAFAEELELVDAVLMETPELLALLERPGVAMTNKQALLKHSFGEGLSETVLNTIMLLVERNRFGALKELSNEFKQLTFDKQGIAEAVFYSAKPLTDEERRQIALTFAPKVGKRGLSVDNVVDTNLLGGVKVRIGDRVYDGSVQGQLKRLEKRLLN